MNRTLPLLILVVAACKRPPPAPEGLDDSSSYLIRHFYDDDAMFQAGVQGFIDWFHDEGVDLIGNQDDEDSFLVANLSPETVEHLPLDEEILVDPSNDTYEPRDLDRAPGVVSLAEMDCEWTVAESYLARPDQHVIFPDDFEGYERTYLSSRSTFEDATASGEFDRIDSPLEPFADDFDGDAVAATLLRTDNMVDPTTVLVANIEAYPMHLDLRHGRYLVDDEEVGALAILTWTESSAWGSGGDNGLLQSYSVELNVERPGDETLRMLAVWTEPKGGGVEPDSALALRFAVNKSLKASERLSAVCAGEEEVEDEP